MAVRRGSAATAGASTIAASSAVREPRRCTSPRSTLAAWTCAGGAELEPLFDAHPGKLTLPTPTSHDLRRFIELQLHRWNPSSRQSNAAESGASQLPQLTALLAGQHNRLGHSHSITPTRSVARIQAAHSAAAAIGQVIFMPVAPRRSSIRMSAGVGGGPDTDGLGVSDSGTNGGMAAADLAGRTAGLSAGKTPESCLRAGPACRWVSRRHEPCLRWSGAGPVSSGCRVRTLTPNVLHLGQQFRAAQGDVEEEPQAGDRGVDRHRALTGIQLVKLEAPQLFDGGRVWRAAEEGGQLANGADRAVLGVPSRLATRMSSSMRWRNGETVGVEMSMVLLPSMNEAHCLDQQHRRSASAACYQRTGYQVAGYRASTSLAPTLLSATTTSAATLDCFQSLPAGSTSSPSCWPNAGAANGSGPGVRPKRMDCRMPR